MNTIKSKSSFRGGCDNENLKHLKIFHQSLFKGNLEQNINKSLKYWTVSY